MAIMRMKSGFPTVAIGKLNGTNWGETKPNSALDVTAFVIEYDMSLTGESLITTATSAPNVGNPEKWDIGWGDGSYDIDNEPTSKVGTHAVSPTATGEMRFLGWNGSPSKVRVKLNSQGYVTNITRLGNFVVDQQAFHVCGNMNFSSASLDNTYVATAINTSQAFRYCGSLTTGIAQLKIDFTGGTSGPGSILQITPNYLGEDLTSWMTGPAPGGSWNRVMSSSNCQNLVVTGWDLRNVGNAGDAWNGCQQNADWTDVFPTGSVLTAAEAMFNNNPNFTGTGLNTWDVSTVRNFGGFLAGCPLFNADISGWDMGNVYNTASMFRFSNSPGTAAMTAAIQNWSFNTSSKSTGTGTSVSANQLVDTGANFIADGVVVNNWVKNTTTGALTQVATVVDANTLTLDDDVFGGLDSYRVFEGITMGGMFHRNNRVSQDLGAWQMTNCVDLGAFFESRGSNSCSLNFDLSQWERTTPGDESTIGNVSGLATIFFGGGGLSQANLATVQDWDVSGCNSFAAMFMENTVLSTNFDTVCDLSNWTLRGRESISMANMFNVTGSCPAGFGSANWNSGTQYVTNVSTMFRQCTNGNPDVTNWNTSNMTNFNQMMESSSFNRDCSAWDLNSASNMTSTFTTGAMSDVNKANSMIGWGGNANTNTGVTASAIFGSSQSFLKSATVGVEGYDGQAAYNGFLTLTAPAPASNRTSGTNTSTNTNQLIDSGATFTATVGIGDVVANTTAGTYSEVVTVDSDTTLTLADDIFTSTSQAYSVDGGYGWAMTGTSFT